MEWTMRAISCGWKPVRRLSRGINIMTPLTYLKKGMNAKVPHAPLPLILPLKRWCAFEIVVATYRGPSSNSVADSMYEDGVSISLAHHYQI